MGVFVYALIFTNYERGCLNRTVWLIGKIIQAIGLFEVLYGLVIGIRDDALAVEFRYAGIGLLIFGIGWLIEKKLAGR
jgi:hypothetical protein